MSLKHTQSNPFFPISRGLKNVIICVLVFYWVLFPLLQGVSGLEGRGELKGLRLILELMKNLLLVYPFFALKKNFGLLHPLIFLPLMGFLLNFIKMPLGLVTPFFPYSYGGDYFMTSQRLVGYELAYADVKMHLVSIIALLAYYFGYFGGIKWKLWSLVFKNNMSKINLYFLLFFSVTTGYLLWYITVFQGGVQNTIMQWEGGRDYSDNPLRWTLPFLDIPIYLLLLWYVFERKIIKKIWFWVAFVGVNFAVFFVGGSRSGFLIPFLFLGAIYVIRTRKIPWLTFGGVALVAYVSIGILGTFRDTVQTKGIINWNIFSIESLGEGIEQTSKMQEYRSSVYDPTLLFHKVPGEVGLLFGKTYSAALLFFIPSTIWENKPHGAGFYNAKLILGRGGGTAIPISAEAEAFWNFWWPGVIIIFLLYGQFHNWMARMLVRYGKNLLFLVLYFFTLYSFTPTTVSMIAYLQMIIPLFFLLFRIKAIRRI